MASFGRGNTRVNPPPGNAKRSFHSEPGIALLGATGAGKSTFLGALQIALLQSDIDWTIWSRDPASRKALVAMNSALTSEGEFPAHHGNRHLRLDPQQQAGAHGAERAVQHHVLRGDHPAHPQADRPER